MARCCPPKALAPKLKLFTPFPSPICWSASESYIEHSVTGVLVEFVHLHDAGGLCGLSSEHKLCCARHPPCVIRREVQRYALVLYDLRCRCRVHSREFFL